MMFLPAIFVLVKRLANVGELEYVRILRLGFGVMCYQTNTDDTAAPTVHEL
jgi:hypothetical protein